MRNYTSIYFNNKTFLKGLILAVTSSTALIVILLCVISVVLLTASLLPYEYIQYIVLIAVAVGVYFGAYIGARINKSQGLLLGSINAVIVFIALIIGGFCINPTGVTINTLIKAIVLLIFSSLGGIKGVNIKEKIRIK